MRVAKGKLGCTIVDNFAFTAPESRLLLHSGSLGPEERTPSDIAPPLPPPPPRPRSAIWRSDMGSASEDLRGADKDHRYDHRWYVISTYAMSCIVSSLSDSSRWETSVQSTSTSTSTSTSRSRSRSRSILPSTITSSSCVGYRLSPSGCRPGHERCARRPVCPGLHDGHTSGSRREPRIRHPGARWWWRSSCRWRY